MYVETPVSTHLSAQAGALDDNQAYARNCGVLSLSKGSFALLMIYMVRTILSNYFSRRLEIDSYKFCRYPIPPN